MPTFATPEPISAVIETARGSVEIDAGDRDETIVEVLPNNPGRSVDVEAAEQTTVEFSGGRLWVRSPKNQAGLKQLITGSPSIRVLIQLPEGSDLQVELASADLRGRGRLGTVRIETASGDSVLESTGPLKLGGASGDLLVDRVAGDVEVNTASGDVRIEELTGSGTIKVASGDARVGELSGDLRMSGASGDLRIERAAGHVSMNTASGDTTIMRAVSGSVQAEGASGSVVVGIPQGTAAWLDVRSLSGTVSNLLDAADGPDEATDTVEVHANTMSGGITIRRA